MMRRASIAETVASVSHALAAVGVPEPRREAELILGHALGLSRARVLGYGERRLAPEERWAVEALAVRRSRREPMAYLLGRREFWSLDFCVTRDTLIPRPESETLIETALDLIEDRNARLRVLDLGTGSGCLLLALLSELPNVRGVGVEISGRACRIAQANAEALGLAERARFLVGDWGEALVERFDVIVANPPYVPEEEAERLEPEITRFEPASAVFGGPDGLAAYRALAPHLARLLAPDGFGLVELGAGQGSDVTGILDAHGLALRSSRRDLGGRERCLVVGRLDQEGEDRRKTKKTFANCAITVRV